jgi:S1-C subfamily serine protease
VDVVVDSAPPGERARYNLAKALSQLAPPSPTFLNAQQALSIPHAVLMDGVTRETGRRLLGTVKEKGGRASMAPHVERTETVEEPGSFTNFLVVMVLVSAIAFALYAWTWRMRNPSGETVKPVGASSDRAARAATVARVAPLELGAISRKAMPGIVGLRCRSSAGTGFLVAPDLLLTSTSALCPPGEPVRAVLSDGREVRGETVQREERLGLALVRIPGSGSEPLALGDASALRAGDHVVLFEGATRPEAHQGVIAETARSVLGVGFLQVDPVTESYGGPILDGLGRVVGIVAPPPDLASNPGLILPINYVYTGNGRLIDPPTRLRPDMEAWNQYLVRVLEVDREEVQRWDPQPALLTAGPVPGRGLVATFLRHAVDRPGPQTLQLTVRTPERTLCQVSAYVVGWSQIDRASTSSSSPAVGSQYFRWLRANDLLQDAYQGFATLDLSGCPQRELRGAEIVLDGGDERADRIRL